MKKILFLATIFAIVSCGKPNGGGDDPTPHGKSTPMNVGTYNVLVPGTATTGEFAWEYRAPRLVETFKDIDFDICGLNEFHSTIYTFISPIPFTGRRYDWWRPANSPEEWHCSKSEINNIGILYDRGKLKIVPGSKRLIWLTTTPNTPSKAVDCGWDDKKEDATNYRTMMWATFEEVATGKKFIFAATHLSLADKARDNSADLILEQLKDYNTEDLPVVLAGDMNGTPGQAFDKTWTADYFVNIGTAKGCTPKGTFNSKKNDTDLNKANRIDHIYLHGDMSMVSSYTNWTKKYADPATPGSKQGWASDHIPQKIVMTLK